MTLHGKYSKSWLKRMSHKYDKLRKVELIGDATYFFRKKEIKEKLKEESSNPKERVIQRVQGNYKLTKFK